jgi:hypothetical protein
MSMANEPDQAETLERAAQVSKVVASTLAKAIKVADDFFKAGRPFDANFFADWVRYEARELFRVEQLETTDADDSAIETQTVANMGLQLYQNGLLFKVLKATNGMAPVPATEARINFFNQQLSVIKDPRTKSLLPVDLNLIYLWECDDLRAFSGLTLLCPKSGGRSRESVTWHWIAPISITGVAAPISPKPISPERDLQITPRELRFDLPIGRPEDGSETGSK